MRPRSPSELKNSISPRERESPTAENLIRFLAALALKGESGQAEESCEGIEEILVDTELDGFRYLLVRLPKPSSSRVILSPREHEIVRMVAQGHPNKVIAGVLNISGWTVCTHLRRIFAKLRVSFRAAMVAKLLEVENIDQGIRRSSEVPVVTSSNHQGAPFASGLRRA
jgi:DNA-binding CsgD family transcriptional regulator